MLSWKSGSSSLKTSLAMDSTWDQGPSSVQFPAHLETATPPASSHIQVFVQPDPQPSTPPFSELSQPHLDDRT